MAHANDENIHIEPTDKWVKIRTIDAQTVVPIDEISNGVFYLLLDNQIHISNSGHVSSYSRYTETVINKTGVENSSQINLEFDPNYQKIVLHRLNVIRDGKIINKLKTAKISIISNESQLDEQIYSGSLTLNILIDDVRINDTVDLSYTREGANPIYDGIFSYARSLNWSVPVFDQYLRVLWHKDAPLHITSRNIDLEIKQQDIGSATEYEIHMHDADTISTPSQIPNWYSPYAKVYFSELGQWKDVVTWAMPLYSFSNTHLEVSEIANKIRSEHESPSKRITAALRYVQDKIRYVALQDGINSHLPTPPNETLELRYGDCKDKAILLIAILKALEIDAYPALVDTDSTKLLGQKPPALNLFDHVLVTLTLEEKRYWLDPTFDLQEGTLEKLYEPDYGFALILQEGQNALASMASKTNNSFTHIFESFQLPEDVSGKASLNVKSEYLGNKALKKNAQIESDGKKQLSADYEVFYQGSFPDLLATSEIEISTDHETGILELIENYQIENHWTKKKDDFQIDFYASDIRSAVFEPKQTNRDGPLSFTYPNNIINQIQVTFEEPGWSFDESSFEENNRFFQFSKEVKFSDNTLTLIYSYKSKTDHIPADQIQTYLAARETVRSNSSYGIIKYGKVTLEQSESSEAFDLPIWMQITIVFYIIGLGVMLISWRMESSARPKFNESEFFPMSQIKFMSLSIVTYGMYTAYWMYRNWKTIQLKENEAIMPIARGIFCIFWFYPLFSRLKNDSITRFGKNTVLSSFIAISFALAYVVISIGVGYWENNVFNLIAIFIPIIFIPLQRYINKVNEKDLSVLQYNSSWNIRHSLTVILCVPLLVLTFANENSLIPSDKVINHDNLFKSDINFLQRKKIILPGERVLSFYSDALFSNKDDGNGFTEGRVFSYWVDEQKGFQSEIATFQEISDIKVEYADDTLSNTTVTIIRSDDTEFMLFISAIDGLDKAFVKDLKSRIKKPK